MQPTKPLANRRIVLGLSTIFLTQFVSWLFINALNIAKPGIINELNRMALFSWLIALPAMAGSANSPKHPRKIATEAELLMLRPELQHIE